jgi:FAD/FMN-containing dehydrogenase
MPAEFSRQAFLRTAVGAAVTGATFGCTRPGAVAHDDDWTALAGRLDGAVLTPSAGGRYVAAKRLFNSWFDSRAPAAVVVARSVSDVQKTVDFAARHHIGVAPRAGGHSYIGASSPDGALVLDLRGLPGGVRYDHTTGQVTVPPATNLNALHEALTGAGRAIPTGSCLTVGIAGFTLGGGLGVYSRRAGLSCDALTSASVVLPGGDTVTASPTDHPDLFWALRGGGGGNFGVTTSMTFSTFQTGDADVVNLEFPFAATAQVLVGWRRWLDAADRDTWGVIDLSLGGEGRRCDLLAICPAGTGPSVTAAVKTAVGLQPSAIETRTLRHTDLLQYLSGGSSTSAALGFVAGSDVVPIMTPAAAQAITAALKQWPDTADAATLLVKPLDGAVADVDPAASAFPWRRQSAALQWYAPTPSTELVSTATRWIAAAHQAVHQYSAGGYVNYLEPEMPASHYFAGNLPRLTAVRQRYDPDRVMCAGLSM